MEEHEFLTYGLCPACFSTDFDSADMAYGPRPVADIVAGCKIGCTFCGLLTFSLDLKWCMVDAADNSILSVSLSTRDEDGGPENQGCIIATLRGYKRDHSTPTSDITQTTVFYIKWTATFDITILHSECGDPEDAILLLAPRKTTPKSRKPKSILTRSFNWVKNQLDECTASHICGGTLEMPLPTRVLDLGSGETPDIRLVVPDEGAEGRYAALSYCWGHSNHFVLTATTMGDLKNGFDICQLPKTLQDAVKVTRQIGLRYLWVDALCIIQGKDTESINDWNTEVAKMDTVYSNAFITISAAAAQNASGGLFRGSHCDLPFHKSWTSAGDEEVDLWARVTWRNHSPGFKSEPINSRAWALQEDLLSTRVLFYASFGLLWKCNEKLTWSYSGESRARKFTARAKTETDPDTDTVKFKSSTSRYMSSIPRDGRLMARSWGGKLELYTARNLTNPHDKLPALSAIAQRYSRCTGSEYLAGLWKSTFRQDLLWTHPPAYPLITVSEEGNPMRGDGYRAPSWSWAAVDGAVTNRWTGHNLVSAKHQWLAEVIVYPIPVLVDPRNPFGGIVKMSVPLQMRGPIETFDVREYPQRNRLIRIKSAEGRPGTGGLYLDDFSETAPWRGRETESLFCLRILAVTGDDGQELYALALLRVHEQKDTYVRIGMAEFFPDSTSSPRHCEDMTIQTITVL